MTDDNCCLIINFLIKVLTFRNNYAILVEFRLGGGMVDTLDSESSERNAREGSTPFLAIF